MLAGVRISFLHEQLKLHRTAVVYLTRSIEDATLDEEGAPSE